MTLGENVQCSSESPCTAVQLLTQRMTTVEGLVNKLVYHLPAWITGAAWVVGIVIGVLGTLVAKG